MCNFVASSKLRSGDMWVGADFVEDDHPLFGAVGIDDEKGLKEGGSHGKWPR